MSDKVDDTNGQLVGPDDEVLSVHYWKCLDCGCMLDSLLCLRNNPTSCPECLGECIGVVISLMDYEDKGDSVRELGDIWGVLDVGQIYEEILRDKGVKASE